MVDSSTQLLSQSNSSNSLAQQPHQDDEQISTISSIVEECIGELNWTQLLQVFLVSFAWFFDGQQTFITIFTDAQPSWHCANQTGSRFASNNSCESTTMTAKRASICELSKDLWAWDESKQVSIISEWDLECVNTIITGLPASMFFTGCLIGGIVLATLADASLGRKNMIFYSCLLMSFSSFLASFSTNIWIYSALKFVCGFGRSTLGTTTLVLASELVSKRWRGQVGVFGFLVCTLGFLTLPPIAYLNKGSSWRNFYIVTSLPGILYCILVYLFLHESPRWLLIRGRKEEAIKVLKSITSLSLTTQSDYLDLAISNIMPLKEETMKVDLYSTFKILMQNRWSSRRIMVIVAMGLGIGLVYYGMPLGVGMLSFNLYLSVTFNALLEIPSTILTFIFIHKFNRKSMLLFLTTLSGISSVLASIEVTNFTISLQLVFELVSFFCAYTAYNVLIIFGSELFPTCVRNCALSLLRQAVALGGTISPMLVGAGREHNNKFLCYGILGLAIGFLGLFGLCLPETKDKAFCDTMDEEEEEESK
ncbi:organic cation/carnitine transporter 3 [Arachis duranensis]|uniref:Organic cation/carnitine transporter 3 n=1 Tax=Arachis duranensis TaxID=130453 RepID=A0A6P4CG53_ARADU|nr:organic cation/carnitine transporter 3 [Arachis duranensis]